MQEYKSDVEAADALAQKYQELKSEIGKVIIGQEDVVKNCSSPYFAKATHYLSVSQAGQNPPDQYHRRGPRP